MNKDQEVYSALGIIAELLTNENGHMMGRKEFDIVHQAILELKAIKKSNPSDALECLEKLSSKAYKRDAFTKESLEELKMPIKQALLKAQEQENAGVGGRTFNKDILNLKECVEKYDDKPILYISRTYGNKYIIPQKQLDVLTNENVELKRVLEILKPYLRLVDNYLQVRVNFYDDYWLIVKEITDEEELESLKKILGQTQI